MMMVGLAEGCERRERREEREEKWKEMEFLIKIQNMQERAAMLVVFCLGREKEEKWSCGWLKLWSTGG